MTAHAHTIAVIACAWAAIAAQAQAVDHLSFEDALRLAFPASGKVERFRPELPPEGHAAATAAARWPGHSAALGGVYVGHSAGQVDAVAIVDNVVGRTEFFTFLCVLAPDGSVRRLAVMSYREPVGDEIRDPRFLERFAGKGAGDVLMRGHDIPAIAGATLSVDALTDRVRLLVHWHRLALRPAIAAWLPGRPSPAVAGGDLVERAVALGTVGLNVRLRHAPGGAAAAGVAADAAVARAQALDAVLNNWRPDSELARLNAVGGGVASPELWSALAQARAAWQTTGGRFDPTIAPLLLLWRDAAAAGVAPGDQALAAARAAIGLDRVAFGDGERRVALPAGGSLDLGGLAKGLIVDACADALAARLAPGEVAALSFGDSSQRVVAAAGVRDAGGLGLVLLRHPAHPERVHQRLRLRPGQGLGCASTSGRTLTVGGVARSHLIDPATATPAPLGRAATVLAPSAGEADALDTALCLMEPAAALALLAKRPGVEALLWDGERFHATPGWPGEALAP